MFDTYLFVQYSYTVRPGEEGQLPFRVPLKVFPIDRGELSYVDTADPDVICVIHRDERFPGAQGDPCPHCQSPLQSVLYRLVHGSLTIFVVEGELAITNPMLDIAQVEPAATPKPKRKHSRPPRPKESVVVDTEEATPDAVPANTG